jgi:regulator of protease activity HflC (stomatin/prohibitin superfamily)
MNSLIVGLVIAAVLIVILCALAVRIVWQYEQGVVFRLGRLRGSRAPGLRLIIPFIDVMRKVSLRIVTMPIQSQGIITRDNVSVDVSAVAYYKVRNLQSLVEIGVDKNTTVVFPAPLMSTSRNSSPSSPARRGPPTAGNRWG